MTTIIHLWKKKSLSHRTKGVRKGNVYSRMMQLLLFYFLSTLYLMFDYLWVCLWLSANHHIHAKSNEYHCRLHLAWFFCSIWPVDLGFTVPTLSSPGFPSSSVTGQSQPPQSIPVILPVHFAGHGRKALLLRPTQILPDLGESHIPQSN